MAALQQLTAGFAVQQDVVCGVNVEERKLITGLSDTGLQQLALLAFAGMTYRSKPTKSSNKLALSETPHAITAYSNVTFQPNVAHISPTIIGLSNGETNKKVSVGPNPAFAERRPRSMGMVEQLQNGVTAPNIAASK